MGQYAIKANAELSVSFKVSAKVAMKKGLLAYKKLFEKKDYNIDDLFNVPEYKELHQQTNDTFTQVIKTEVSGAMREYLNQDSFVFSALKTDKQLREARSYLLDENGEVRSFQSFENKVRKMNVQYNARYLEAEYNFAVHSAQSAEQWQDYNDDTSRYLLQFRTAGDEKVRDSHAELNGTTLPKDDAFWSEYYPPLGWNCRCKVMEVLARKYKKSNSNDAIDKGRTATGRKTKNGKEPDAMFRFNPGKDKKLFPPKNNYVPKNCTGGKADLSGLIGFADVVLANEGERCKAYARIKQEARKVQRKKVKQWAKENLQGETFSIGSDKAELNGVGIKEIINQPHKHYFEKNALLYDLPKVCKQAVKSHSIAPKQGDELVKHVDVYQIKVNNEASWILVKEFKNGKRLIYSIVDKLKK